jgi:hypothetical protein
MKTALARRERRAKAFPSFAGGAYWRQAVFVPVPLSALTTAL